MWLLAGGTSASQIAVIGTVLASATAVLTSLGTLMANRAARRRAETEAARASEQTDVDKSRLSLEGLTAYADRLEKENTRLRDDNDELRKEVEELRDLRELIDNVRRDL